MKRALLFAALGVGVLHAAPSEGQPSSPRTLAAEELFRDGRALIASHRYREACEKLTASQKLDPAVGTLVSLGECNTGLGRSASAWLAYRSAIALATERNDPRRAGVEERAAAVEPQISRLTIRLSAETESLPTQIAIDGEPFARDGLGAPVPMDPGPHSLLASAPGYRPWSARVQVGALGDSVTVAVPALEPIPDRSALEHARSGAATKRAAAFVVGGVGLAGLGVGAILGLQALVKIRDANTFCPSGPTCSDANAVHENQVGKTFGTASSVVLPVSAALLGAGTYLFFTSRASRDTEVGAELSPGGARLRVAWSW